MVANGDLQHRHLAFALRLLSDSVQFAIEQSEDERKFLERTCSLCDSKALVDVCHLLTCSNANATQRRQLLAAQLMDILEKALCSEQWLATFRSASFLVVIRNMFSAWDTSFVDDDVRCFRSAFGCFSHDEFDEAMSTVGVSHGAEQHGIEHDVRRLLLLSAYEEWRCRQ